MKSLRKDIITRKKVDLIINPVIIFILSLSVGLFSVSAYYFYNMINFDNLSKRVNYLTKGIIFGISALSIIYLISVFRYQAIMPFESMMLISLLATISLYFIYDRALKDKYNNDQIISAKDIKEGV